MGLSSIHGLYAVKIDAAVVGGITAQGMPINNEIRAEPDSGEEYARQASLIAQNPIFTFSSYHLETALTACGIGGFALSTGAFLTAYAQQWDLGGARKAGSTHRSFTFQEGILVPQGISCDHQGDAAINYQASLVYDGTNDPIEIAEAAALATASAGKERFSLFAADVAGVTLTGCRSLEIDFGIDVATEGSESDVWPTFAAIREVAPVIRLRGFDSSWFGASGIGLAGAAPAHADTIIYLRKRAEGGTFAAADNIKITAAGIVAPDEGFAASGNNPGEASLVINCINDGSNAPLVITTAQADPL